MSVRAKFAVTKIESTLGQRATGEKDERGHAKYEPCEMKTLVMNPVYGNGDPNHENTKFWQASPGGELRLNVVNAAAVAQFELGKEYYVDFSPAD
jgi:hypothetical protein